MRAGLLLRRGWRATVFLALLAGLAGGVAMAAWSIGRRASTSFDRFLAYADPSDFFVSFCPPDIAQVGEDTLERCYAYDAVAEAAVLRARPEVDVAGRIGYVGFTAVESSRPNHVVAGNAIVSFDEEPLSAEGRPIIVDGRRVDPAASDEITVNERFAELAGVAIGDELDLAFWAEDERGEPPADGAQFTGPRVRARIVGIERNFRDLIEGAVSSPSAIEVARASVGPGIARQVESAGRFGGVAVTAKDGDVAAAQAAVDEAFAGRFFNVARLADPDETEPISEAITYEATGTVLFGAITALAAAAFAGQAVSRQSRREWRDGATLRALGMSRQQAGLAALARGLVTGTIAVAVAIGACLLLSPVGPFGAAGLVEIEPGAFVDPLVLALGTVGVAAVVTLATWGPVTRQFRRARPESSTAVRPGLRALQAHLPAPAAAGLSMSLSGRGAGGLPTGTALAGVVLTFGTALGAAGLTASLDGLVGTPANFGAPWDVSVSADFDDPVGGAAVLKMARTDPRVVAAAGLVGTDATIGDEIAWVQAYATVNGISGFIAPVITSGRAPAAINEVALGTATMASQGLSIGDTIAVRPTTSNPDVPGPMTVVGATIVNDTSENNPGRGGLVTTEWIDRYASEASADPLVLALEPDADADQFRAELRDVATGFVEGPKLQGAILNVRRVRWVPVLLAALVGVLAIASLAHALVMSVRRQHRQLAILKSLGFRRRQVQLAVAFHATVLVLAAAVVGVPLGIIIGRWGWRLVADELGVASPPVTPVAWLLAIVAGIVVLANLVAAYPAWRAARRPTARALRVE